MQINGEIWIASHVPHAKGMDYLLWALESCRYCQLNLKIPVTVHLSIYWDYEHNLDEDLAKIQAVCPNTLVHVSDKKLEQFEHLQKIYNINKEKGNPDDIIVFLDDDDLLFPQAFTELMTNPQLDGQIGWQIIPIDSEGKALPEYHNLRISDMKDIVITEAADDFSGTSIRRKHLACFFDNLEFYGREDNTMHTDLYKVLSSYLNRLIDVRFMQYVENLPNSGINNTIVAFHRIKEYLSRWKEGLI